jgi:hypothetical protein
MRHEYDFSKGERGKFYRETLHKALELSFQQHLWIKVSEISRWHIQTSPEFTHCGIAIKAITATRLTKPDDFRGICFKCRHAYRKAHP